MLVYDPTITVSLTSTVPISSGKIQLRKNDTTTLQCSCTKSDENNPNSIDYQWYRGTDKLDGKTESSLEVKYNEVTTQGVEYKCGVTCGTKESSVECTVSQVDYTIKVVDTLSPSIKNKLSYITAEDLDIEISKQYDDDRIITYKLYTYDKSDESSKLIYTIRGSNITAATPPISVINYIHGDDYVETTYYWEVWVQNKLLHTSKKCTVIDTRIGISSPLEYIETPKPHLASTCKLNSTNWTPSILSAIVYKNTKNGNHGFGQCFKLFAWRI